VTVGERSGWWSIAAHDSRGRDLFCFSLQLNLLGNAERVIDLDAQVADCAFEFGGLPG
jgi:hypothetical protein